MAVIEAQWWKRERAREHEVAVVKAEYAKLEQQTKALLSAVQARASAKSSGAYLLAAQPILCWLPAVGCQAVACEVLP